MFRLVLQTRRLNVELDRITEQKEEWIRMLAHCQRELIERQAMYDEVKGQVLQMKLANDKLSEEHAISTSATEVSSIYLFPYYFVD